MTKELDGLIIRVIDYKESSLIIHLLTNNKIESIIARGVKKLNSKLKGYILSFNYVKCFISDSKIPILTDILIIDEYKNIQNNIRKNMYAGSLINILYKEQYENMKVYELALKSIKFINDFDEEYYYNLFLLKNLHFMGLGLNVDINNLKDIIGFNITESKICYKNDSTSIDLNKEDTIKLIEAYYSKLEEKVDIDLKKLHDFLVSYYLIHASIKI